MKRTRASQFLTMFILVMVAMQLPALAHFKGQSADPVHGGLLRKSQAVIETEEIEIVIATPESFDVNEPIYAAVAAIRNAKAVYVKPLSIKFELYSTEFGEEFVIGTNEGGYDAGGNWVTINQAEVERFNDFIYYTKFNPFLFEANLTMRVTVEWFAPWRQVVTRVQEKNIRVGATFNVTGILGGTKERIKESVLNRVNVGIDFAIDLVQEVDGLMDLLKEFLDEISEIINYAGIDPGIFNFYVLDLIGNSTDPGCMYDIVKHDLYSHLSASGSVRDDAMDARHAFIMNSFKDSLTVLGNKIGWDTDASDGDYNFTVTFVRDLYELYTPDNAYIDPNDAIDSLSSIVYSNEQGNITGGSFDDAYAQNGQHEVSLELVLETFTGAHPKFKSPLGAKYNIAIPRKSIIINTMGPYFPILNSWYQYYELDVSEHPTETVVPLEDVALGVGSEYRAEQFYGDYTNQSRKVYDSSNVMKNIRRIALKYNDTLPDGGCSISPAPDDDMYDNFTNYQWFGYIQEFYSTTSIPVVNYGWFAKRLADGMGAGFYYWINAGGGKPFSRMTRDIDMESGVSTQRISDHHHEVLLEIKENPCKTSVLSGASFTANPFDIPHYFNKTMFQLIDAFMEITGDSLNLEVDAEHIGFTNTEYYKISTGRWVDAFFNGTDLSRVHGKLGDSNYITAAPDNTPSWYSPKALHHSFTYEDTFSFYQLGLLGDYNIPNQYTWVPFVGPNSRVPIGWMTGANMWYSVIGTDDLQMGLEYLYGGIYMGYKQTVLNLKNMALMPVLLAAGRTSIPEARLSYLLDQAAALDEAWANLDLLEIDRIGGRITTALADRGAGDGGNIIRESVAHVANLTNLAYGIVAKDEDQYSFIDTGLDTAGSDLTVGAVGDAIKNLIETNVRPALAFLSNQIQKIMAWISATKGRAFDSVIALSGNFFELVDQSIDGLIGMVETSVNATASALDQVGGTIEKVAVQVNETVTTAITQATAWTVGQIRTLENRTKNAFGTMSDFISDTVLEKVKQGVQQVGGGIESALDAASDRFTEISNEAQAKADKTVRDAKIAGTIIGGTAGVVGSAALVVGTGGTAAPAVAAGLVASGVGLGAGGAIAGGFIGDKIGNLMSAGDRAKAAAAGVTADVFSGGADAVAFGTQKAVDLITGAQDFTQTLGNIAQDLTGQVADYSADFVENLGGVAVGAVNFGAGIAQDFGEAVGGFGANIQSGVGNALAIVEGQLDKATTWTKQKIDNIIEMNKEILRTVIRGVSENIKSTLSLVSLVITILQEVSSIFESLVEKVNEAFDFVADLFATTAAFLIDLAGTGIQLAVDFSQNVARQLQEVENQIASSSGFYEVIKPLLNEIRSARTSASLIEYATQTIGVTKELFFKWTDVVQPVSRVRGGDTSFRLFQMGNVFADRLYFLAVYQGEPVVVDNASLVVTRLPQDGEIVPGGMLEADIPLFKARYDNGSFIDGLYYASFSTSDVYDWYGDSPIPVKTEAPIPTRYLTRFDANLTGPLGSPHEGEVLNNTWLEETELFDASLTVDAFPIVSILSTYDTPITGGTTVPLVISVRNDMFSKPTAEIEFSISTSTGLVIANRRIGNIVLPSSDEGEQAFELEFTPLSTTPAGSYDLLVTVVEPNGDTVTKVTSVTIRAATVFEEFTGFFIGLIGAILGFFGLGAFIAGKKKTGKALSGISGILGSMRFGMPPGCSVDDALAGKCTLNGVRLDCDVDAGTCNLDL